MDNFLVHTTVISKLLTNSKTMYTISRNHMQLLSPCQHQQISVLVVANTMIQRESYTVFTLVVVGKWYMCTSIIYMWSCSHLQMLVRSDHGTEFSPCRRARAWKHKQRSIARQNHDVCHTFPIISFPIEVRACLDFLHRWHQLCYSMNLCIQWGMLCLTDIFVCFKQMHLLPLLLYHAYSSEQVHEASTAHVYC